jgi:hypothetical protein
MMIWQRALLVWFVIILAETVHGVLRQMFLVPLVGDLPARQIGVLLGSLIIFAITWLFSRWLGARTIRQQLGAGFAWVALTIAFEFALGATLGLSLQRMLQDYDPTQGGFMVFGLLFMLLAPALAAWTHRRRVEGTWGAQ